jgi:hypothetical protein
MTGQPQWQQPGAASAWPAAGTLTTPPQKVKVRPRRIWYLLALAVFLGGVAWLALGISSVNGQVNGFQRVPLPQGGLISLSHSGSYVVYYEGPGAASGNVPNFNVRVAPASAGASVTSLQPYTTDVNYSFGSRQGRAVLTLKISHAGSFRVVPTGAPTVKAGSDLAFGSSIAGGIVRAVLAGVLLMVVGLAAGIVLLVTRLVRTARRRRAING